MDSQEYRSRLSDADAYYDPDGSLVESLFRESFVRMRGEIGIDFGGLPRYIFDGDKVQASFCLDRSRFVV